MARRGKRELRRNGVEVFWRVCHDPAHHVVLWIPDDESLHEFGEIELVFGYEDLPLGQRLGQIGRTLLGRRFAQRCIALNYADAVRLRNGLDGVIRRIEALAEPGTDTAA
jgi:hypothetical protein